MKQLGILTLAAAVACAATAFGQTNTAYTKPSGYVTHTLKAGQFNLVGLTLHEPVVASGVLEAVVSNNNGTPSDASDDYSVLTDDQVNFSSVLTTGQTYILEITEAADANLVGTIQEVTAWDDNTFTTPQDLYAEGLRTGDKYQIRTSTTLQHIFGEPAVIKGSGAVGSADVVWVPDGNGGFTRYFYKIPLGGGEGSWHNANTNTAVAGGVPLIYADAVMVQMKAASPEVNLVVTGTVKTGKVSLAVFNGFNLLSVVYPVGSTLQNSGIESQLKSTASVGSSDVIWLPDGNGDFTRYYYRTPLGGGASSWYNASTNSEVSDPVTLPSAIFVQRKDAARNLEVTPPPSYGNL